MPLTKSENCKKRNKPLQNTFKNYADAGLENHFLFVISKEIYEKNSDSNGVPTTEFFSERKKFLKDLFLDIVKADI